MWASEDKKEGVRLVKAALPFISDSDPSRHSEVDQPSLEALLSFAECATEAGCYSAISELKPHVKAVESRPAAGIAALTVLQQCTQRGGMGFRAAFKMDKWADRLEEVIIRTVKQEVRNEFVKVLEHWGTLMETTNGWANENYKEYSHPMSAAIRRLEARGIRVRDPSNTLSLIHI
eukprot:TRINITY_DN33236_c0_g1_i4.p1 TRINITY_DN33236_c0_g1~~TRINITY_DN33236_c0_g1_i4.p1  ORF type:complete len:176 (-),score=48.83 TRINITY_DN33236_c0_g1_i4:141-668(-)